jgi:hypothetical protein
MQGGWRWVFQSSNPSTLDVPEDVLICLSTDKTCALKVKRINYPASATSRKGKKPIRKPSRQELSSCGENSTNESKVTFFSIVMYSSFEGSDRGL